MKAINTYPKILPLTGLLAAILLTIVCHFLLPTLQIVPGTWRLLGLLSVVLGIAISFAAEKQFHQANTTVNPFQESSYLVVDGLYRFSRNPMYLGMVLVLLGISVLFGSLIPFVVTALFTGWIDLYFIHREEQMLFTQFGKDWLKYKASVRRWI